MRASASTPLLPSHTFDNEHIRICATSYLDSAEAMDDFKHQWEDDSHPMRVSGAGDWDGFQPLTPPMTWGSSRSATSSRHHGEDAGFPDYPRPDPWNSTSFGHFPYFDLKRKRSWDSYDNIFELLPPVQESSALACNQNDYTIPAPPAGEPRNLVGLPLPEHCHSSNQIDNESFSSISSDYSVDSDDDDEWSGDPDGDLETNVLNCLGNDMALAAQLIPLLHKNLRTELKATISMKVGPWRSTLSNFSSTMESANNVASHSSGEQGVRSASPPRKRRKEADRTQDGTTSKRATNGEDDDEEDDGDEHPESKRLGDSPERENSSLILRLACPFHKVNPSKYSVHHTVGEKSKISDYRSCAGPGFKNIQRLKEHLKRKHYPVQCDRCYETFSGSDRPACVLALENHRQLAAPCERRDSSLKEGISDAQWAGLDKKKISKQTHASSRIEKYWEIWDVLFPDIPRPATPWYDQQHLRKAHDPFAQDSQKFTDLFGAMLGLQVTDQRVRFPEGLEEEMTTRLKSLAQKAFSVYVGMHGIPSATNSSSSRSRTQTSLFSGSYECLPTTGIHSSSASHSTATPNQLFRMPPNGSPVVIQGPFDIRAPKDSMPPPLPIASQRMVQDRDFFGAPSILPESQGSGYLDYHGASWYPSFDNPDRTTPVPLDSSATTYSRPALPEFNLPSLPQALMNPMDGEQHEVEGWSASNRPRRTSHNGGQ